MRFYVTRYNDGVIPSTVTYNCKSYLNCVTGNGNVESKGKWRMLRENVDSLRHVRLRVIWLNES